MARWASIGSPVRSPTAQTLRIEVAQRSSICTNGPFIVRSSRSRPKPVDPGAPAGGDQHPVGRDAAPAAPSCSIRKRIARVGQADGPGTRQHLDAQRLQAPGDRADELLVVGGRMRSFRLDHRDLGAELGEGGAELEPDIARADHGQAFGNRRQRQRLGRGDDAAAERQGGQRRRHRAGRQHDVLGADDLRPVSVSTRRSCRRPSRAVPCRILTRWRFSSAPTPLVRRPTMPSFHSMVRAKSMVGRSTRSAERRGPAPARPRARRRRRHG